MYRALHTGKIVGTIDRLKARIDERLPSASLGRVAADLGGAARDMARVGKELGRPETPFQLRRYLDYCSEMLSLNGKVAALYAQDLDDPWRKIAILQVAIDAAQIRAAS